MRRVVITGMGSVTPVGIGNSAYLAALQEGRSGAGPITHFDPKDHEVKIACEVKGFDPNESIPNINPRIVKHRMDLVSKFAVAATNEAMLTAGYQLDITPIYGFDGARNMNAGAISASGVGGLETLGQEIRRMTAKGERGPGKVSAFLVPKMMINSLAYWVCHAHSLHGVSEDVSTACASFNNAVANSYMSIQSGLDFLVTLGAEAAITPESVAGFTNMGALSKSHNDDPQYASRPFDAARDGFVMGEGGAAFIVEPLDRVLARGAEDKILAEIVGYGKTTDGLDITAPDENATQVYRAMKLALEMAGISPEEVDYINAHGTSTPLNDRAEALAINRLFPHRPYVNSTKSMIGHALGASGALELAATLLCMQNGLIHKTINLDNIDEACDLNHVRENTAHQICYALLNSFGFGGHNSVILVKNYRMN